MHHPQFSNEMRITLSRVILSTGMTRAALTYYDKPHLCQSCLLYIYLFMHIYHVGHAIDAMSI